MRLFKVLLGGILFFIMLGCASYSVNISPTKTLLLNREYPVYITLGQGQFTQENRELQEVLKSSFGLYSSQVLMGGIPLSLQAAFKLAQTMRSGYLVYPTIEKWEDHNTPWSTIRDKVVVQIILIDAQNMRVLNKSKLEGKSTTWTMKNDTPAAILPELIKQYVDGLYKEGK